MSHLWSGRFKEPPDSDVFEFQASLRIDQRLFEDDVRGSIAWAEALQAAGVLSKKDSRTITTALSEILKTGRDNPDFFSGSDEDVHAFVERQLVARIGEVGKKLHTGRSRNEQVSLDLRLYLRRRLSVLQTTLERLISVLADQAEDAGQALMPAYTHLRRAQPVLAAHFFLAHAAAFRRDHVRFDMVVEETDALPLGSGAVAGASYPIDTAALASQLGFTRVVVNSIDAAGERDFVSSYLHACALTMVHLSRLAEDFIIFSAEEFGFFELSDSVATGSSLMPQKKNPDPLELIRGKTGRTIGHLAGWLATLKGLPSGYNKDLQEDKEAVFDAEMTTLGSLRAATTVIKNLSFHAECAEFAASGLLVATDVADYLVSRGMPFRRAHEVVGGMVRELSAAARDFSSLTLDEWRSYSELFDDERRVLSFTANASVDARQTPQSTNPEAVANALVELRAWLTAKNG